MKKQLNYQTAYMQLQKLVNEIENEEIHLDKLAEKVKQANELIAYCQTQLRKIENDVKSV